MEAVIICGPPACGKSTQAKHFVEVGFTEINKDNIRFNVIMPGGSWKTWRFNKKAEKEVKRLWWEQIRDCAFCGRDIVISDTMSKQGKRHFVMDELEKLGYNVFVYVMNTTPLEELLRRNSLRGDFAVAEKIIIQMHEDFIKQKVNQGDLGCF